MERKKVLLVDDEPISLNMLCEFLKDANYLYDTAINGKEALSKLESNPDAYFVVVMDRLMPFMSGMEVLEKMQASPVLSEIPVIMLTGLGESEDILDAVKGGVFEYLTKPVDRQVLLDLIAQILEAKEKS